MSYHQNWSNDSLNLLSCTSMNHFKFSFKLSNLVTSAANKAVTILNLITISPNQEHTWAINININFRFLNAKYTWGFH